jgi:alkylhydroperoxidase family enzyme
MQRLPLINSTNGVDRTSELFARAASMFGAVPNNVRTAANSPRALESLLGFFAATADLTLGSRITNQVLLAVSEANACEYCTALLTNSFAPKAGLTAAEILAGRSGTASDPKEAAALRFAKTVLESRGRVADADLTAVRKAGFGNEQIAELVATVALGCFTNFLNNVAETTLDIPKAEPLVGYPA